MKPRKDYGCPLRIWDNGGRSFDRYTILPPRSAHTMREFRDSRAWIKGWEGISASERPSPPFGFGQHISGVIPGPHLGKRITWAELPAAVQLAVRGSFLGEYCPAEV